MFTLFSHAHTVQSTMSEAQSLRLLYTRRDLRGFRRRFTPQEAWHIAVNSLEDAAEMETKTARESI